MVNEVKKPNEAGETQAIVRWMLETPDGWVGSWDKKALENLQRDAERYRALRKMHWSTGKLAVVFNPKDNVYLGATCPSEERLDTLVDQLGDIKC